MCLQRGLKIFTRKSLIRPMSKTFCDPLTGLPNREFLEEAATKTIQLGEPFALVYIDIDNFKNVNDTLGHAAGDLLLKTVAEELKSFVIRGDIVCRIAGDEFVLILKNPRVDLDSRCAILLNRLNQKWEYGSSEFYISASAGVAIYPEDAITFDELLQHADNSMYHAKENGKNTYVFYTDEIGREAKRRAKVIEGLKDALKKNQLEINYQPQFNIKNGKVAAVEALVRWRNPEWGIMLPAEFIPISEKTGQICGIDLWVFESVCAQIKDWHDRGLPSVVCSVNFSVKTVLMDKIERTLLDICAKYGVAPSEVGIEMRESIIMQNKPVLQMALDRLRCAGFYLTIDNFGSGYSSLFYIGGLPVKTVKLQRHFVTECAKAMGTDEPVKYLINLAHSFGMTIVAGGIENEQQNELMRNYNFDSTQGYHCCGPMSAEEFEQEYLAGEKAVKV